MAEPVMDNPLAPSPHAHFQKVIQDIKECIAELKQEFEDSGIPINDDSVVLHRFCAKLEYILQAGLKARTGLLGGKKDYWNYFCDSVSANKSTNDGIRFVKTISELKTNLGRGRAFLRFCLMHQRLADTIQQCAYNKAVTSDWYHPKAMWHQPKLTSDLINSLYDLSDLQFDLSPRGYDLDASWPSFARKTFGTVQHVHNWSPPSRSTSIGSLSSIPNQEAANPPSPSPHNSTLEAHKLQLDLNAANRHQQEAQQQLESMENEKLAAESKIEQAQGDIKRLEQALRQSKDQCRDLEVECDKLANELKLKEEAWKEKEERLKSSLTDAENCIAAFGKPSAGNQGSAETDIVAAQEPTEGLPVATGFQATELGIKLLASEKRNQALKIEMKSLELQLASKTKVEEQKTTLISLLDRKLEATESKKKRLLDCLEMAVKQKEETSKRLVDATNNMTALNGKVIACEAEKKDLEVSNRALKKTNLELKDMLGCLEEKSSKIANLAKEKVTQYKEENVKLREELEQQSSSSGAASGGAAEPSTELAHYRALAEELQRRLEEYEASRGAKEQELALALQGSEKLNQEIKDEMEKLRQELQSRDEGLEHSRGADSERLVQLARESTEFQQAAKSKDARIEELENVIQSYEANERKMKETEQEWQQKLEVQMEEATRLKTELASLQVAVEVATRAGSEGPDLTDGQCKDQEIAKDTILLQGRLSTMVEKRHTLQATNSELQEQAGLLERAKQELQLELARAGAENADLKAARDQAKASAEDLEATVKITSDDLAASRVELKIAEDRCASLEQENLKLDEEARDLKMILEMKNQDIAELVHKLKQAKSDREMASENQESERTILQDQVIDLQSHLSDLQVQFKVEEQAKERLQVQLENANSTLKREIENQQLANQAKGDELEALKEEVSRAEEMQQEMKNREDELQDLQREAHKVQEALQELQDLKQKEDSERLEQLSQLQKDLEVLGREKDDLCRKRVEEEEQRKILESETRQHQSIVTELQSKQQSMQEELELFKEARAAHEEKMQMLLEEQEVLQSDRQTLQTSHEQAVSEIQSLRHTLSAREAECDTLKQTHTGLLCQMTETETSWKAEKQSLEKELSIAQENLNDLRQTSGILEREKQIMSETLNKSSSETEHRFQELLMENSQMKQDARKVQEGFQSDIKILQLERTALQSNITQLEGQIEQFSLQFEQLETNMKEVQAEAADLRSQLTSASQSNEGLQEEVISLREQLSNANEVMLTKDSEYEKMKLTLEKEVLQLQEELRKKEKMYASESDGLQKEILALRYQLSSDKMIYEDAMRGYEAQNSELACHIERLSQQEALIETLEVDKRQLREQKESERQKLRAELQELRESLSMRDEEYELLGDQYKQAQTVLDTYKADVLQLQNDIMERKKEWKEEQQQMSIEMQQLSDDNEELKKRLIQLLREKDSLWQKSEKLEHLHKIRQSERWVDDSTVTHCLKCNTEFSFLQRKHHCRVCGRIFCHSCSNQWMEMPHSSKKERVCSECLMNHSQLSEISFVSADDMEDGDPTASVQIPNLKSPKWGARDLSLETEEPGTETQMKQPIQSSTPDTHQTVGVSDAEQASAEMSQDERDTSCQEQLDLPDADRTDSTEEDGFDVITKEEIQVTKHDILPSPTIVMSPCLTTAHIASGDIYPEDEQELWIKPGKMYGLQLLLEAADTTLSWQFATQPKNIYFSVSYRPTEVTPLCEAESLIPSTKVNSHKLAITGKLEARKPGVYTLVFDNTFSRFTSKKLEYTLNIQPGSD